MSAFDRFFRLTENNTSVRTELVAGATTFVTMVYIIFVQPAVLSGSMLGSPTGMDFGAVTTATCLAAALGTAIMGLAARYPIALAPGMGQNFFFVLTAIPVAAAAGAALGTSTVTSYIESAAGVEHGGRTGLTALTVAVLFLVALFFYPVVAMVGSYPPITAPALVLVGAMMVRNVTRIEWEDYTEGVPAFLTMIGIPFFYSIADGIGLGLITYPVIKSLGGKAGEVRLGMWLLGIVLLLYFVFVRSRV